MAATIQAKGETVEVGAPAALFQTRIAGGGTGLGVVVREQYAVEPDGRFLMNVTAQLARLPEEMSGLLQMGNVAADGERFLINTPQEEAPPIYILSNWARAK